MCGSSMFFNSATVLRFFCHNDVIMPLPYELWKMKEITWASMSGRTVLQFLVWNSCKKKQ
jgi:hypothetical protein